MSTSQLYFNIGYNMHKLFALSHLRTLARLNALEFTPAAWEEVATKNALAPSGDAMLYRLPRE